MDTSTTLLSDLLPTGVLDYFEISSLAQDSKTVTVRLTEKNIIPEHNKSGKLISKGFYEAVQQIRIEHRWQALEQENKERELAKEHNKTFIPCTLDNGDTPKQLLARSRYLLFKSQSKWTAKQILRAEILFKRYPDLEKAYHLAMSLGQIYTTTKEKGIAFTRLAQWFDKVEKAGFKSFGYCACS